jgi:hypothetical protein
VLAGREVWLGTLLCQGRVVKEELHRLAVFS